MKCIILAAGQGSRLRPYTNDRPKCMVPLGGKPLLYHQLEVLAKSNIALQDTALVCGYLQEALADLGFKRYENLRFAETNMVTTLFCAAEFMERGHDLIVSYGDIVYEQGVLQKLIDTEGDIVVAADVAWEKLWSLRMAKPLDDAETFRIDKDGFLYELGKKPGCEKEVEAQYMGLIKVKADKVEAFKNFYYSLNQQSYYDGNDFDNMYMTSFLQCLIDDGWKLTPALVEEGWVEVDTVEDLDVYEASGFFKSDNLK